MFKDLKRRVRFFSQIPILEVDSFHYGQCAELISCVKTNKGPSHKAFTIRLFYTRMDLTYVLNLVAKSSSCPNGAKSSPLIRIDLMAGALRSCMIARRCALKSASRLTFSRLIDLPFWG